jgi:hypothetical protein
MYGACPTQVSTRQNQRMKPLNKVPPGLAHGREYGSHRREESANSSYCWLFMINIGRAIDWQEEIYHIQSIAHCVTKRRKWSTTSSPPMFLLDNFGFFFCNELGWEPSHLSPSTPTSKNGEADLLNWWAPLSKRVPTPSSSWEHGCYGGIAMHDCVFNKSSPCLSTTLVMAGEEARA